MNSFNTSNQDQNPSQRNLGSLTHVAESIRELSKVHRAFSEGRYALALALAEKLKVEAPGNRIETEANLLQARCYLKLGQPQASLDHLLSTDEAIVSADMSLLATYFSVSGLINRYMGVDARNKGNIEEAKLFANWSLGDFRQARAIASEHQQPQASNNRLNELLTAGFISAIDGTTKQNNLNLLVEALLAEDEIRRWSAPVLRNDIVGVTIIADFARGLDMEIQGVDQLDTSVSYAAACANVLGHNKVSWPALILATARNHLSPPAAKAKGLILGVAFLEQDRYKSARQGLVRGFQVELWDACESIRRAFAGMNSTIVQDIMHALHKLDDMAAECLLPSFAGLRAFR